MATEILGILNITADSFSDGGNYLDPQDALEHAETLWADGAHILDLGPASSHPDAAEVSSAVEIDRLRPVVAALRKRGRPFSIDSYHSTTQLWAIEAGAAFLNDIHGFPDPAIYPRLARSRCRLIVMHSIQQAGRATRERTDPAQTLPRIVAYFEQRLRSLEAAGIHRERLVLDPGLGFFLGDTPEPSLIALSRLAELKAHFGLPVLICPSKKSFLRAVAERPLGAIGPATLAAELFAVSQGADFIRTHEPRQLTDALKVWEALAAVAEPGLRSRS